METQMLLEKPEKPSKTSKIPQNSVQNTPNFPENSNFGPKIGTFSLFFNAIIVGIGPLLFGFNIGWPSNAMPIVAWQFGLSSGWQSIGRFFTAIFVFLGKLAVFIAFLTFFLKENCEKNGRFWLFLVRFSSFFFFGDDANSSDFFFICIARLFYRFYWFRLFFLDVYGCFKIICCLKVENLRENECVWLFILLLWNDFFFWLTLRVFLNDFPLIVGFSSLNFDFFNRFMIFCIVFASFLYRFCFFSGSCSLGVDLFIFFIGFRSF
jgi:hypothetical protein